MMFFSKLKYFNLGLELLNYKNLIQFFINSNNQSYIDNFQLIFPDIIISSITLVVS